MSSCWRMGVQVKNVKILWKIFQKILIPFSVLRLLSCGFTLLFFFLHHLLLFIFTSKSPQNDISVWLENLPKTTFLHESIFCFQIPKSPQNDIFRSNFGSKFGLSWRSLRFAALRCCSYKVHYVNMVYGLKCCLKFWYNSCIFFENVFNGRSDRTEDRLGRVCFLGQCYLTFIWEEQKIFWSFFYSSE